MAVSGLECALSTDSICWLIDARTRRLAVRYGHRFQSPLQSYNTTPSYLTHLCAYITSCKVNLSAVKIILYRSPNLRTLVPKLWYVTILEESLLARLYLKSLNIVFSNASNLYLSLRKTSLASREALAAATPFILFENLLIAMYSLAAP